MVRVRLQDHEARDAPGGLARDAPDACGPVTKTFPAATFAA
ncbi:hypothetical protein GCM10022384_56150 [Streptomyces marokkonensis]|uniref:Uncharacterized protein n=1 Tax=Streptomyces marokkonensis TaxID=324855 RepID=A0ABP7RTW7_9ACTN